MNGSRNRFWDEVWEGGCGGRNFEGMQVGRNTNSVNYLNAGSETLPEAGLRRAGLTCA